MEHDSTGQLPRRRATGELLVQLAIDSRFRALLESLSDWVWEVDEHGTYTYASSKVKELLGYAPDEVVGHTPFDFMPAEEAARVGARFGALVAARAPIVRLENLNQHKDGRLVALETSAEPFFDERGAFRGYRGIDRDVTERLHHEARHALAARVFESTEDGILVVDADNRIVLVNPACERITGYASHELVGQDPRLLASRRNPKSFYEAMWQALLTTGHWQGDLWNRRKSGEVYVQRTSISTIPGPTPRSLRRVAVFSDVTREVRHAEELEFQATHDALTGLPNRRLLVALLERELARARREAEQTAVLMLDLDGFKHVNDTYGHHWGDHLLVEAATRLRGCLRAADTLGRLGGDEFMVVLGGDVAADEARLVAAKLGGELQRSFTVDGAQVFVTASIGVALGPADGDDASVLVANADAAMYQAKAAGKNDCRLFAPSMHQASSNRLRWETELRRAVEAGQFELHYQPIIDLRSRQVVKAEALVRWRHPERGLLAPGAFIGLAEETGLIVPLGAWVAREALRQLRAWRAVAPPGFRVSVNVSPAQFQRSDVLALFEELASGDEATLEALELEITEGTLLQDTGGAARDALNALVTRGASIALDDFGTGYSSLSYLLHLPIQTLKIDRSFVSGSPLEPRPRALVEAILRLAESIGMAVVAEGIETEQHAAFLVAAGCALGQGFWFSRPVPAEEFRRRFLAKER
jgi:diguanylate cyclase (GGDEF)-like protein/PAS domain S-box-containing protein